MHGTILVSTAGQGVLRSNDDGATWNRIPLDQALEFDAVVRTLAVHPTRPEVVFAGADAGLGRSDDGGTRWSRVDSPFNDKQVWSIAIDPNDPDSMLVGTGDGTPGTRTRVFRSDDLAGSWTESTFDTPANSTVWAFGTHPSDADIVFAGTKYGHLFRSTDGGRTFTKEWREVPG